MGMSLSLILLFLRTSIRPQVIGCGLGAASLVFSSPAMTRLASGQEGNRPKFGLLCVKAEGGVVRLIPVVSCVATVLYIAVVAFLFVET
jgi:hypothetical protein